MGQYNYFKLGDWQACCDVCGLVRKASMLRLTWDGLRSCHLCWEPRNSQDYVRGVPDPSGVPWSRQRAPLQFVNMATRPDGEVAPVTPLPEDS